MNIIRLLSILAIQASTFTTINFVALAQAVPTVPQQTIMRKICSFDAVEELLPSPFALDQQNNTRLSYLKDQGFREESSGSWVCYVNEQNRDWGYYTLFRVQQLQGKVIASSFLKNGSLINGQDYRSLDLFMSLIEHNTNIKQGTRQSIQRYLQAFITLIKQGKITPSRRGYIFDQPNNGYVVYHPIFAGQLKGTAITININTSQK
ncbi:hypothetical protein G7B40_006300 [Aetokthonos hydrillicola Thurmond2011]|uniref:DUF4163 domain-containing protein n=1 Tax=Aetokthonos hydrillicola Thurmond2011 TaxID=2712845 RepID=A0AAP5M909_9CYAN|nr:hypothetical protein [Aetokthonos hydrillicola]MBO3458612.1 hypothetical protein [Aetokthonos hydrillicola CCALA 1050]MBW4585056.1 hypothetical protein [Aetokthonos hydrillicola CCALA 1050]MDR9894183.1 hypothetical protein [Aetokthonos hydrillicola Thurmond2011]